MGRITVREGRKGGTTEAEIRDVADFATDEDVCVQVHFHEGDCLKACRAGCCHDDCATILVHGSDSVLVQFDGMKPVRKVTLLPMDKIAGQKQDHVEVAELETLSSGIVQLLESGKELSQITKADLLLIGADSELAEVVLRMIADGTMALIPEQALEDEINNNGAVLIGKGKLPLEQVVPGKVSGNDPFLKAYLQKNRMGVQIPKRGDN